MLQILDIFFLIFHTGWMLFNLIGWGHPKTRKWNLFTLSLTAFSWVVMGFFYGWGYCICTDWHWQVLRQMGEKGLPNSYLSYLVHRFFGIMPERAWMDGIAVTGLVVPLILSSILLWRDRKRAS